MRNLASLLEAAELAQLKQVAFKLQQELIEASDGMLDVKLGFRAVSKSGIKADNEKVPAITVDVTCDVNDTAASYVIQASCWLTDSYDTLFFLPEEMDTAIKTICKELAFIDVVNDNMSTHVSESTYNRLRSSKLLLKAGDKHFRAAHACMKTHLETGFYLAVSQPSSVGYRTIYLLRVDAFTSKSENSKKFESVKAMMSAYNAKTFDELYGGMLVKAYDLGMLREFELTLAANTIYSPVGDQLSFLAVHKVHA